MKKELKKFYLDFFLFSKVPRPGRKNVLFMDSPDFENLPDFRTRWDALFSRNQSFTINVLNF